MDNAEIVTCSKEGCDSTMFIQAMSIFRIPMLYSQTGQEEFLGNPVPAPVCLKCHTVLTFPEARPNVVDPSITEVSDIPEKKEDDSILFMEDFRKNNK